MLNGGDWRVAVTAIAACLAFSAQAEAVLVDLNGDGFRDLAVGAPGDDVATGGNDSDGALSLLYGTPLTSAFTGSQFITQDSPGIKEGSEAGDQFGAVIASGDFDRDGFGDLAVSAPFEDVPEGANDRDGAVHILYGRAGGIGIARDVVLTQATKGLRGDDPEVLDLFGSQLTSGDFDGDRFDDLAIGVLDEDIGDISRAGVVHVLYGGPKGITTKGDQLWSQAKTGVAGDGPETPGHLRQPPDDGGLQRRRPRRPRRLRPPRGRRGGRQQQRRRRARDRRRPEGPEARRRPVLLAGDHGRTGGWSPGERHVGNGSRSGRHRWRRPRRPRGGSRVRGAGDWRQQP